MKPEQKKALTLVIVAGFLGVGLCAYFWFMIVQDNIAKANTRLSKATQQVKVYNTRLKEIADFREVMNSPEYQLIKARVAELEKRLPTTQQANLFYEALTDALEFTGVTNTLLEKMSITDRNIRYEEIPYKLAALARYHQFGQFLNIIEENPDRFMRVKSLVIGTRENDPTLHPINVQVATFRFISRN